MSQYIFILVWIAAMFFLKSVMSGGYRVENILGKKSIGFRGDLRRLLFVQLL